MKFNKLVQDRFGLIFQKNNLHIIEQLNNYVKIESDKVIITISHDNRENSNSFYIGRKDGSLCPVEDTVLKDVFHSALKINHVTPEVFVNNLAIFFEGVGKPLIAGNTDTLKAVEKYINKESDEYTTELVNKQHLDAANKAWKEGNYKDFIKHLDKIDRQKLPLSYELKYKMAHKKLKC